MVCQQSIFQITGFVRLSNLFWLIDDWLMFVMHFNKTVLVICADWIYFVGIKSFSWIFAIFAWNTKGSVFSGNPFFFNFWSKIIFCPSFHYHDNQNWRMNCYPLIRVKNIIISKKALTHRFLRNQLVSLSLWTGRCSICLQLIGSLQKEKPPVHVI